MVPPTDSPLVLVDDTGTVRLLTLSRPGAANAFDRALSDAFAAALADAAADDGVHVVIVTGAGKHFSAGADLGDLARGSDIDDDADDERPALGSSSFGRGMGALIGAISTFRKPLVAAVNGAAVGIGVTMLLHCDLAIVSDRARLRLPFTSMGVSPEAGSTVLLPRLIGRQQAARLLFTSTWVNASEAVDLGLALSVSPHDALLDDAQALAAEIGHHPLTSLVATKELLLAAERDVVDAAIARESASFASLLASPGVRDGLRGQTGDRAT